MSPKDAKRFPVSIRVPPELVSAVRDVCKKGGPSSVPVGSIKEARGTSRLNPEPLLQRYYQLVKICGNLLKSVEIC